MRCAFGTERSFGCIGSGRALDSQPYVLTLSPRMDAVRTHPLPRDADRYGKAAVTPDGTRLVIATQESEQLAIISVDLGTGEASKVELSGIEGGDIAPLAPAAIDPGGSQVLVTMDLSRASVHALPSGELVRELEGVNTERRAFFFTRDLTVWDGSDRHALVAYPPRGPRRRVFSPCNYSVESAIVVTDTKLVGASDSGLCVHQLESGALDLGQSSVPTRVPPEWRGDELIVVTSSLTEDDISVPLTTRWSLADGRMSRMDQSYAAYFEAFSPEGKVPPPYGGTLTRDTPYLVQLAGNRAIVRSGVGELNLMDLATGRVLARLHSSAVFRGAGREIVDTSEGLRILSSRDGSVVRTLRPLRYSHDLVIAPDGAHAVLLADGAELVSLADGASIARFDGSVAAFRPDGREVAFGTPRRDEETGWRIVRLAVPGG